MRKLISAVIVLYLLASLALPAFAQQEKIDVYQQKKLVKSVVFQVGLNEYFVDNKVPGAKMDVAPFVENGRTFVPVRFLSNALGVQNQNIFWFGDTGQVKLQEPGFPVVELAVGKAEVLSNGSPVSGRRGPLGQERPDVPPGPVRGQRPGLRCGLGPGAEPGDVLAQRGAKTGRGSGEGGAEEVDVDGDGVQGAG